MWWFKGVQLYHNQQSQTSSRAADTGYSVAVWSLWSDKLMFYSSPFMSVSFPIVTFSIYFWLCTVRFFTISDGICDWNGGLSWPGSCLRWPPSNLNVCFKQAGSLLRKINDALYPQDLLVFPKRQRHYVSVFTNTLQWFLHLFENENKNCDSL